MDDYLGKYSTKHFSTEVIGLMDTTFLDFNKGLDFLLGFVDSLVSALNGQLLLKQTTAWLLLVLEIISIEIVLKIP